jgi:hypothetical protein
MLARTASTIFLKRIGGPWLSRPSRISRPILTYKLLILK